MRNVWNGFSSSVASPLAAAIALALAAALLAIPVRAPWSSEAVAADRTVPKPAVDLPPAKPGEVRKLVLAAGCFWCVEAVFERLKGVREVTSGFAGGTAETAKYDLVSAGGTQHAESVEITYDDRITYGQLLQVLFTIFDPTTLDRQGPDAGHQYRSAIFYKDAEEQRIARAYLEQLQRAKVFDRPIVTALEPLTGFYPAEAYHQDYVRRHPDHPYVRQWSVPKLIKLREHFGSLLDEPPPLDAAKASGEKR